LRKIEGGRNGRGVEHGKDGLGNIGKQKHKEVMI